MKPGSVKIVSVAILLSLASTHSPAFTNKVEENVGPMVGTVDSHSARLLVRRGSQSSQFELQLLNETGTTIAKKQADTNEASDFVAHFSVDGLQPATRYLYRVQQWIDGKSVSIAEGDQYHFSTLSAERTGHRKTICFTSCVDIEPNPMWNDMRKLKPDLLCLMGDTPYIDSTDLTVIRQRHREFLNIPVFNQLIQSTPTIGTWDDHDFGVNNGNGRNLMRGKANSLKGFTEYRAHQQYGNGAEGVYHKIDLGMIEVFLLDPRYFSQTAGSPVDPEQPTCLGVDQWNWLLKGLKESNASFKVLAMGAIWQDKKNAETDDMFTYWYEREALFDFIIEEKIGGIVLLGGDIHVSRHLIHRDRLDYDLHDFIISPGHGRVITELDVYHPDLQWSLVDGHQFLELTADGTGIEPVLTARFLQGNGKTNRTVEIPWGSTMPLHMQNLQLGLRAWWNFDGDFRNHSIHGGRYDAVIKEENSEAPKLLAAEKAAQFQRSQQQYLVVPANPLDDNSDQHAVSLWFRPQSLPKHQSDERHFLIESTAEGKVGQQSAWHLSLGIRAADQPDKVNLEIWTHTLAPAEKPEVAPQSITQGGFRCLISRDELKDWSHVALLYDSKSIKLFLNGQLKAEHQLPVPGPASEFGGLIIGGHRGGKGRNFDGMIDEVAIWKRLLTLQEIEKLSKGRDALKQR